MAKLCISPQVSLADEPISVQLFREPSDENEVSAIRLKLNLTNHSGINFQSVTDYKVNSGADAEVILDLDRDLPNLDDANLIGIFNEEGPFPMYPFWSLTAQPDSMPRFVSNDARKHFDCHILAFDANDENKLLGEANCQRLLMAPGVRRIPIAEDICNGTLFLPPQKEYGDGPYPLVIRLYGGIQKGNVIEDQSAVIAARAGVASFSMGFFGINSLPKSYLGRPLDLDYFDNSLEYLFTLPEVRRDRGALVVGSSKGGEIAMLLSAFLPDKISAVISINGNQWVLMNDVTYKGQTVLKGYFLGDMAQVMSNVKHVKGNIINVLQLNDLLEFEGHHSTIPINLNKDAKFMFIASGDDQNYDMKRNQKYTRANICEWGMEERSIFLDYPRMGHLLGLPYDPPMTLFEHPVFPKGSVVEMGGSADPLGHSIDQGKAWAEIVQFVRGWCCKC